MELNTIKVGTTITFNDTIDVYKLLVILNAISTNNRRLKISFKCANYDYIGFWGNYSVSSDGYFLDYERIVQSSGATVSDRAYMKGWELEERRTITLLEDFTFINEDLQQWFLDSSDYKPEEPESSYKFTRLYKETELLKFLHYPLNVDTESQMDAMINSENVGKMIMYTGITGKYENGRIYRVMEVE